MNVSLQCVPLYHFLSLHYLPDYLAAPPLPLIFLARLQPLKTIRINTTVSLLGLAAQAQVPTQASQPNFYLTHNTLLFFFLWCVPDFL